jgi:hypothetical protein
MWTATTTLFFASMLVHLDRERIRILLIRYGFLAVLFLLLALMWQELKGWQGFTLEFQMLLPLWAFATVCGLFCGIVPTMLEIAKEFSEGI